MGKHRKSGSNAAAIAIIASLLVAFWVTYLIMF